MLTTIFQRAIRARVPDFGFSLTLAKHLIQCGGKVLSSHSSTKMRMARILKLEQIIWNMMDQAASSLNMWGQRLGYVDANIGVGQLHLLSSYLFKKFKIDDLLECLSLQPIDIKIF
jgi:hypothetical protein